MKTILDRAGAVLATLAICLLPSCGTSPPRGTATNTYVGTQAGKQADYLGDRDLARQFVLLNTKTERKDERLRVQFDLKNTTSADLAIEWSVDWKDANGFRIDTNPHWRPLMVAGQGLQSIQAQAPVAEAAMFQLQVRKPTPIR
jgi:uncharacterized protein YcfL